MERTNKLADLKLVSKHYPVSNFSYPRPDAHHQHHHHHHNQHGRPPRGVGRSSVGSDCSAPGMVDDHESDISAEDDYQYHVSGAELWDSFWQANPPDAAAPVEAAKYPALIPSPAARRRRADVPIREEDDDELPSGTSNTVRQAPSWPLPPNPLSTAQCPKAAAAYSLFPAPLKTPSRPFHPPRTSSMSQLRPAPGQQQRPARPHRTSALSLPSIPKPRPAPIDFGQPGWATHSAAITCRLPTSPPIGPAEPPRPPQPVRRTLSKAKSHATLQSSPSSSSSTNPTTRMTRSASTANFRPVADLSNPLAGRAIKSAPPTVTAFELLRPSRPAPKPPVISVFDSDTDDDASPDAGSDPAGLARRLFARAAPHRRSASEGKKSVAATGHSKLVKHSHARADTAAAALLPPGGAAFEVHRVVRGPVVGVRRQPSLGFQRVLGRWSH